jgi:hypothetical protein
MGCYPDLSNHLFDVMSMKPIRKVLVSLLVLGGCFLVWCAVDFFRPYVREYSGRTRDDFVKKAGMDFGLPQSAHDICYVASSVSIGGRAHVVKFTAPLEDCRSYAVADFRRYGETPAPEFVPMVGTPAMAARLDGYGIHDLQWFDVGEIKEGITLKRDHDHRPFTWIDTRRGVFYSLWTD